MKPTKPTHKLKAFHKLTEERDEVGVGWLNKDGSMSIRFNFLSVIRYDPNIVYTLFPVGEWPKETRKPRKKHERRTRQDQSNGDEEKDFAASIPVKDIPLDGD